MRLASVVNGVMGAYFGVAGVSALGLLMEWWRRDADGTRGRPSSLVALGAGLAWPVALSQGYKALEHDVGSKKSK